MAAASFFETKIEYLKGIGPTKGALLQKELNIFTYADLLQHYPYRYLDRTQIYPIGELSEQQAMVQVKGRVLNKEILVEGRKQIEPIGYA